MLVHPTKEGFNLLANDMSPFGKRHFVIISEARFIIDPELQRKSFEGESPRMLIHAWCAGLVVCSQYGTIPSYQQYDGWARVNYNPKVGDTMFTRMGDPVDPEQVFPVVVCTRYRDKSMMLTPP